MCFKLLVAPCCTRLRHSVQPPQSDVTVAFEIVCNLLGCVLSRSIGRHCTGRLYEDYGVHPLVQFSCTPGDSVAADVRYKNGLNNVHVRGW
jgi:hypothetical protein